MNQSVVNSSNSQIGGVEKVKDALKSLPAMSIVTDQANLTSAQTGIYSNPRSDGIAWERESSLEKWNGFFEKGIIPWKTNLFLIEP